MIWLLRVLLRLAGLGLLTGQALLALLQVGRELLRVAHAGGVEWGAHWRASGKLLRLRLGRLLHIGIIVI